MKNCERTLIIRDLLGLLLGPLGLLKRDLLDLMSPKVCIKANLAIERAKLLA